MCIEPLDIRVEVTQNDESLTIRGRNLFIEDCDTVEIARQFGTPVFVISKDHLRRNVRSYKKALSANWPEGQVDVLPAFKAAPYLAFRRILSQEGTGCDTFGAAGVTPDATSTAAATGFSCHGDPVDPCTKLSCSATTI